MQTERARRQVHMAVPLHVPAVTSVHRRAHALVGQLESKEEGESWLCFARSSSRIHHQSTMQLPTDPTDPTDLTDLTG